MLGLFSTLKDNVPVGRKLHEPSTEGFVNRLHYRVSVMLLLGCSLIVTCLEWIGNGSKISCVMEGAVDSWTIPQNVINTYCYVMTTFTLPKHWNSKTGHEAASIGVGAYNPVEDDVTYKAYYQWVPFVLFLQGIMFYLPHLLFKAWEGGKVRNIMSGLNQLILDKRERAEKERVLAEYFVESLNTHNLWAAKMLVVEFLNLANVIFQIIFVDVFLGGQFSTYGMNAVSFLEADPEKRIDPMAVVFPRVTKCSFYKYGPSGSVQTHDAICVLPVNIVNEKIYVVLWFWFILMAMATVVGILYHFFVLLTPGVNRSMVNTMNQDLPLENMGKNFQLGDWKLLYLLSKNMEPLVFGEFVRQLYRIMFPATRPKSRASDKHSINISIRK